MKEFRYLAINFFVVIFLLFLAGWCAFHLWWLYLYGAVLIHENIKLVCLTEFAGCLSLCVLGVVGLVYNVRRLKMG